MKRRWKITLIVFAVLIVGCAVTIGGVFYATSGLTTTADDFFKLLKDGKTEEAYAMTSSLFHKITNTGDFASFAKMLPFSTYEGAVWNRRSLTAFPSTAIIEGTTTFKGEAVPTTVEFTKEGGKWKIQSVDIKSGIILQQQTKSALPSDAEITALVKSTVEDFAQAIGKKDFAVFYGAIAALWKAQTNPEEMKSNFAEFEDTTNRAIDFASLKNEDPVFSAKPLLNENNFLVLEGYYPAMKVKVASQAQPIQLTLRFTLKYTYENPAWKLVGLYLALK